MRWILVVNASLRSSGPLLPKPTSPWREVLPLLTSAHPMNAALLPSSYVENS